jgi:hypothetical protein
MPDGIDEILTIRLLAHPVNAEMRSRSVGHHISATFELRASKRVHAPPHPPTLVM